MMRQLPCLCYTTSSHGFKGADQRGEHSMAPAPPLTQNSCPGKTPCEGTTATPGRFGVILQKPQGFHIPTPHSQHRTTPGCSSRHNKRQIQSRKPQESPHCPPATHQGDIFPWPLPGRRDTNKLWEEAGNNNPESCKHLEVQCFALQFCIDFLPQIDF